MNIFCCKCKKDIQARLTDGKEIYPHREDLFIRPFWKCDECGNYVGCHYKTDDPTRPLGNIPFPLLRDWRRMLHNRLDPIWKAPGWSRNQLYKYLSRQLGWNFHISSIRSIKEAKEIYLLLESIPRSKEAAEQVDNLFGDTDEKKNIS
jgi:hypothetical protein